MCAVVTLLIAMPVLADDSLEEIVVTGIRAAGQQLPATSLKKQADYLLLKVEVSNDSREYKTRREEIYATLRAIVSAAAKDKSIELSIIRDDHMVLPLKLDDTTLNFTNRGQNETLATTINIKTRVGPVPADAPALIAKLKNFVSSIKAIGRTQIDDEEEAQVSVVNIAQYRDTVIQLFANDVKKITTALGDYRVVVRGLDSPIQWVRDGTLDVIIFVPYEYDVVPTTISSFTSQGSKPKRYVVEE
jgi:hypothetical protein